MVHKETPAERPVDRRRLLRRAGTVAVGVAGAGVVSAVAASPAMATDGDTVKLGSLANNWATSKTIITSDSAEATLELDNTKDLGTMAGAPLRLLPRDQPVSTDAPGNIGMTTDGRLWTVSQSNGTNYADEVYSSVNATTTWPINPVRAIDTRSSTTRARVLNASGNIDSSGRVIGGHTINVDLSDLVYFGWGAFGNLTVVSPTAAGFATLYPYGGTRPATSSINFQTSTLSNAYVCALGYDVATPSRTSVISIYVQKTAAVILDVNAFVVSSIDDVSATLTATSTAAVTRTSTRQQLREQGTRPW
jgi:hypothetical protein